MNVEPVCDLLNHMSIPESITPVNNSLFISRYFLPDVFSLLPDLAKKVPVTRFSVSSSERTVEQTATEHEQDPLTFLSLRDPLVQLLLGAITHEANNLNKQLLLHTLNAIICDIGEKGVGLDCGGWLDGTCLCCMLYWTIVLRLAKAICQWLPDI